MKKSKKALALLLASTMAIGVLGGCSSSSKDNAPANGTTTGSGTSTGTEDSNFNPPGTLPIVKEPITLTIFAPSNGEYSWLDNPQTAELEEKTGIHLEWQIAASSDSVKDKISTMFASKKMPDIILTGVGANNRYDKASEAMFGAQGLVLPLNEYLDSVSVGYKAAFEELDGLRDYITTPDGNIYSLPNVDGSLHIQYNMKLWLNTTWLDNLGLEMPTTTDELYNVLKAFKEQDANGNGDPNDEIPLSTVTSGAGTQIDGFLMNPFQLTPETKKIYLDNKKVTYSPIQDNYKEGLKYLNKLYAEGLLNPESFTQDKDNQVNVNEAGPDCVIGAFLAQRPGYACDLTTMPNSKKWEQYQSVPPLKGPDGNSIAAWDPYVMYQTGMAFISSTCSNPEAAFRFIDYLATEEGSMRSAVGIEGVHWNPAKEGELGMDGKQALYTRTDADTTNQSWTQLVGLIRTPEMIAGETTNQNPYAEGIKPLTGRQIVMYRASQEHEKVKQPLESVMPELYMSETNAAEMSLLSTTINDTQRELMVQFITGVKDIDKDWDSYKSSLESVGLSRYLELLQQAYDDSSFSK